MSKNISKKLRGEIENLKGKKCFYCGAKRGRDKFNSPPPLDHYIARINGGKSTIDNLYPACPKCNNSKHSLTIEEWVRKLWTKTAKHEK